MTTQNSYPLGIVGEQAYQAAIRRCRVGEAVSVIKEPDNPYDRNALRVTSSRGDCIGYIPRTSWLQDAVHQEGKGVAAVIMSIANGGRGFLGVVIAVTLTSNGDTQESAVNTSNQSTLPRSTQMAAGGDAAQPTIEPAEAEGNANVTARVMLIVGIATAATLILTVSMSSI